MSLTQKEVQLSGSSSDTDNYGREPITVDLLRVNESNPFQDHDYGIIIKAFEIGATEWEEEDYALAYHYKDVYGTSNFSTRVRKQMDFYPGMHQKNKAPEENPFETEQREGVRETLNFWDGAMDNPASFESGLRSRQEDFDYTKIFNSDTSAKNKAKELGKMITECIPCFDELLDPGALLPTGDLLEVHGLNIKIRGDMLKKIKGLFDDPGANIDICELLNLFSHICPRQLLAMINLLTQYLAKLNLDVKFNINFIIELVGPILSPFLDGLSQWLDMWIQLILKPMICVIDNINETIGLAQNMKIPFGDISGSVSADIDASLPFHQNVSTEQEIGGGANSGVNGGEKSAGAWGASQWEKFNTPDEQRYNTQKPEYPIEETQMSKEEIAEAWKPSFNEQERTERDERWAELRKEEEKKRRAVPAPLKRTDRDGKRWSKDDISQSEKWTKGDSFDAGSYHPPEDQERPGQALKYIDPSPIVNSVVQLRNILQGAVQYVEDWFTYVTQMIYDLLGTEVGWMSKKADNTIIKSNIIKMLMMIKAIIRAVARNGLQCGLDSNFNPSQLKYILEEELNQYPGTQYEVNNDGTVTLRQPGVHDMTDTTNKKSTSIKGPSPDQSVNVPQPTTEEPVSNGVVIKSCFKDITKQELAQVKEWIADFERRSSN